MRPWRHKRLLHQQAFASPALVPAAHLRLEERQRHLDMSPPALRRQRRCAGRLNVRSGTARCANGPRHSTSPCCGGLVPPPRCSRLALAGKAESPRGLPTPVQRAPAAAPKTLYRARAASDTPNDNTPGTSRRPPPPSAQRRRSAGLHITKTAAHRLETASRRTCNNSRPPASAIDGVWSHVAMPHSLSARRRRAAGQLACARNSPSPCLEQSRRRFRAGVRHSPHPEDSPQNEATQ
ncbi:hypothetical protein C8J57DRAFT_1513489 [Mycena rebaudengoi]|nr:hypothetical protein C8J57DRAFT_1513489 [Mycena rebaudengoi]